MKKILILGANSYIGTSFRKYLTTEYPEQYIVDTGSLRGDAWRRMDWSGYESILNVTGKAHADISSLTEEQKQEYYAVNCDLAREAAEKAIADGAKQYIYLSSIIVYGDSSNSKKPVHITAKTKPAPSNFYGDSKWQAEQKLQELFAQKQTADTRLAILRLPMIYGPGCKGNYRTLQKMAQKLPLFPTYHNERSVLQIEHLAEYLRMLVDSGEEGLFWPQDETYRSTPDMIFELAEKAEVGIFSENRLAVVVGVLIAQRRKLPLDERMERVPVEAVFRIAHLKHAERYVSFRKARVFADFKHCSILSQR